MRVSVEYFNWFAHSIAHGAIREVSYSQTAELAEFNYLNQGVVDD